MNSHLLTFFFLFSRCHCSPFPLPSAYKFLFILFCVYSSTLYKLELYLLCLSELGRICFCCVLWPAIITSSPCSSSYDFCSLFLRHSSFLHFYTIDTLPLYSMKPVWAPAQHFALFRRKLPLRPVNHIKCLLFPRFLILSFVANAFFSIHSHSICWLHSSSLDCSLMTLRCFLSFTFSPSCSCL